MKKYGDDGMNNKNIDFLSSFVKTLPIPVIVTDSYGNIIVINEQAKDFSCDLQIWTIVRKEDHPLLKTFFQKSTNDESITCLTEDELYSIHCKRITNDFIHHDTFVFSFIKRNVSLHSMFEKIVSDTLTGLVIIDRTFTIIFANDSFKEMFLPTHSPEIVHSLSDVDVFGHTFFHQIQECFNGKKSNFVMETKIFLNGEHRYYRIFLHPNKESNATYLGILLYDITEKKKSDEFIDLCWKNLSKIFEKSPFAFIKVNAEGYIKGVNEKFEKLTQFDFLDMKEKHITQLMDDREENSMKELIDKLNNGKMEIFERKIKRKDGEEIFVLACTFPFFINEEIQDVYIALSDITSNKQLETEWNEMNDLLNAFFEHSNDMICITDARGKILRINKKYEEIFGWTKEELEGETKLKVQGMEYLTQYEYIKEYLKKGLTVNNFETTHRTKSGDKIDVSLSISPIFSQDRNLIAVSFIYRDIRDKKQTDELLKKSEQLALIGQLAAGVAHEIRNPLTTLKGFVQLLKEDFHDQSNYYDIMMEELNRIEMITNEFLALSKPHIYNFELIDINDILQNVVSFINMEAIKANVTISFQESTEKMCIKCDGNRLKQVFLNILKNAIESMNKGGIINVSLLKEGLNAQIIIRDQGIGIPKERLKFIGQPFYSTKEKGTGLGLMISNKIIKEHKGNIQFDSQEGKGTTVTVSLPLADQLVQKLPLEEELLKNA